MGDDSRFDDGGGDSDIAARFPAASDGLIAGRFRVAGLLGTGGSASVFRALDMRTGEAVAVKILHPALSREPASRRAFVAEADRIRGLRHPHLAGIVDAGIEDGPEGPIAWIAQQLAVGSTLAETVALLGPLTATQATTVGIDLLGALAEVHAAGLVHRDVSPSNVMVAFADGAVTAVTLLDFGLADASGRTAHGSDVLRSSAAPDTATVIGNVRYASPEQLRGEAVGPSGDIYQTGATLYFALTGSEPFPRADVREAVRAQLVAPPPVASARVRGIPPALDRAIVRAMLKHPEDRYPDASAFAADLRAVRGRMAPVAPVASAAIAGADDPEARTRVLPRAATGPAAPGRSSPYTAAATGPVHETAANGGDAAVAPAGGARFPWLMVSIVLVVAAALIGPAVFATTSASGPDPGAETGSPTHATPQTSAPPTPVRAAPAARTVPSFAALAEASAALEAAGLRLGAVVEQDSARPRGTVLGTDPAVGATAPPGSSVALTVASGRNAVPAIAGMSRDEAFAAIRAAGFVPWELAVSVPGAVAGTAVTTRPDRGVSEWLGNVITVLIAGEAGPTPGPSPDDDPATSPSPTPVP